MHTPLPQWVLWSELAIRLGWAAIAAVVWFVMSRRGHDGTNWVIVGLVLGPFAVPAAVISTRRAARRPAIVVDEGGSRDAGLLVVVDPDHPESWSPEAELVNELGAVAELVVVVSRDTMDRPAREASLRRARTALAAVAAGISGPAPRQVIIEGRPAAAVVGHSKRLGEPAIVVPKGRLGELLRRSLAVELPAANVRVQQAT